MVRRKRRGDVLWRIKGLVVRQRVVFTEKARLEMESDGLLETDVLESLVNATSCRSKRSTSKYRRSVRERVYIIEAQNSFGVLIYTKGLIRRRGAREEFYVLISSKRSIRT